MRRIGRTEDGKTHFHCVRCGTLKSEFRGQSGTHSDTEAPAIVYRARALLDDIVALAPGSVQLADRNHVRALRESATGSPDR